ncbi:Maleate isomerase [compost metagenome]
MVTSAGALVEGIKALGAKKVSLLTPYMKPLTRVVIDYIENEGIEVVDSISLEIADNLEVANRSPFAPAEITKKLITHNVDAIIASACVQMPSLQSVQIIEDREKIPVLSSSVATTYLMLKKLGLPTRIDGFGELLSGAY